MKNNYPEKKILNWLLAGDVSIQYQVHHDLFDDDRTSLRKKIATEGWGAKFLSYRNKDGHWGRKFYQPKWTSTHYTLLDLSNLQIPPDNRHIHETINLLLDTEKGPDGGMNPSPNIKYSDVCLNGMALNYLAYFGAKEEKLHSIVDFIIEQRMDDGGFNCFYNNIGAKHSSLHSTLSVLEGILTYCRNGYSYRKQELKEAEKTSQEFILCHQLFLSDRTGRIIHKNFLKLTYPSRWRYDILRALDYFRLANRKPDTRMKPAIEMIYKKRLKDGRWKMQAKHPGQVHFVMEQTGKPSRWNTLRALRVLKYFE
jgi:hypothetical protein